MLGKNLLIKSLKSINYMLRGYFAKCFLWGSYFLPLCKSVLLFPQVLYMDGDGNGSRYTSVNEELHREVVEEKFVVRSE